MIKQLRYTLTFATLLLSAPAIINAATVTLDGFTYTTKTSSGVTTVTVKTGPKEGDVVIPDSIPVNGVNCAVVGLDTKAFQKASITSVKIPVTVTKIGTYVFEQCKSLAKVEIVPFVRPEGMTDKEAKGKGLSDIGSYSFKDCSSLKSIDIPNTVSTISSYAFQNCVLLESVTLPQSLSMFMSYPFRGCTKLRSVTVNSLTLSSLSESAFDGCPLEEINASENCTKLASIDGVLYDKQVKKLLIFPAYKKADTYTMPSTVTSMSGKFIGVQYIKVFESGDALTSIAAKSFQKCPELTTVKLGAKVSSFGYGCFSESPKFATLEISAANPYIKYADGAVVSADNTELFAFIDSKATTYKAPEGLKIIKANAFSDNAKITDIEFSSTIDSIGDNAFSRCTALKSVTLPGGVKHIAPSVFYNCRALASVVLPQQLETIGEYAFYS
ncbi:MAG: leucine-rich repeat domain-containing protein, partial [Muribaculaceae bacterium]|nr:leucine-rich repeat domain-containing protein [Muribaculaceae bacterium]